MTQTNVVAGDSPVRRLRKLLSEAPELSARFAAVRGFASTIRAAEYHLTNACNIRCKGCWFFEHDFDKKTADEKRIDELTEFVDRERRRGINAALLIGGEPTLFPDRIRVYVEKMDFVTISTNGLRPFPRDEFKEVTVAISLFGGGPLDDDLRAIKPSGKRFVGLFDKALENFRNDERAGFVFAVTESGLPYVEPTVARIADNGNRVNFNFYSAYHDKSPLRLENAPRLLDEVLRVRDKFPDTVISHPYYIRVMITGKTEWGKFSYDVCPSVSVDNPLHADRLRNGNPTLPLFNTYAADLKTVQFCCTSGHCKDCRDSQAVFSWLMVSVHKFLDSSESLRMWIEVAESYWSQFYWSPFHPSKKGRDVIHAST